MKCRVCEEDKPESDYYPRNKTCKACYIKKVTEYQRGAGKESHNRACKKYNKTEKGKVSLRKAEKNYQENYPNKKLANWKIKSKIRCGQLKRPKVCEQCGTECSPDAHHDDYTKPLEVRWFCTPCHQEWHRHNTPIYE
ncbi:hypothetical protein ACPUED_14185 [Proteus mirabilis]|uniref:hypothetical protein n=1 Tax=Proteus mirabilis TaxID=584 RepID=UPI0028F591A0|nr:hypothetical protein [Proteus mirabilis]